jgi:hypothetical protein
MTATVLAAIKRSWLRDICWSLWPTEFGRSSINLLNVTNLNENVNELAVGPKGPLNYHLRESGPAIEYTARLILS